MTTAQSREHDWDAELQVYAPHRAGLPPLRPYFRDLVHRLPFAAEFSRSGIRAAHTETVFGQLWLVLNPLLLALVYYLLVGILQQNPGGMGFLAHLTGGLFVFFFFSGAISSGASSVTGGGRLILNMAFPRLLMPLAAVRTAFIRFLPTLPVYIVISMLSGTRWSWWMPLGLVFFAMLLLFSAGMAAFMATVQVYFRDATSFLPYVMRIWLYVSPILWYPEAVPDWLGNWILLNPLYSLIGGWTELTLEGVVPSLEIWLAAAGWTLVALVGGSLYFMSRERDFAVRI